VLLAARDSQLHSQHVISHSTANINVTSNSNNNTVILAASSSRLSTAAAATATDEKLEYTCTSTTDRSSGVFCRSVSLLSRHMQDAFEASSKSKIVRILEIL